MLTYCFPNVDKKNCHVTNPNADNLTCERTKDRRKRNLEQNCDEDEREADVVNQSPKTRVSLTRNTCQVKWFTGWTLGMTLQFVIHLHANFE